MLVIPTEVEGSLDCARDDNNSNEEIVLENYAYEGGCEEKNRDYDGTDE
jgi:hypothetical protein